MAIPTSCKCGFKVSVKDNLAGKNVKCPRCQGVMQVPNSAMAGAAVGGGTPATAPQVNKKLLDLLDDEGVKATPKGPICAACGAEMDPTAIICIECGYNVATGQYLDTYTDIDADSDMSGMTDAEKTLARAEQEIDEAPIGAGEQDFGDGADSYIIAMVAFAVFAVLILLGLGTVLIMESVTDQVSTALISAIAGSGIYVGCMVWISVIAFRSQPAHGVACVATGGLYCPIFGIMRGSGTIAAAVVMLISLIIAGGSWAYWLFVPQ